MGVTDGVVVLPPVVGVVLTVDAPPIVFTLEVVLLVVGVILELARSIISCVVNPLLTNCPTFLIPAYFKRLASSSSLVCEVLAAIS